MIKKSSLLLLVAMMIFGYHIISWSQQKDNLGNRFYKKSYSGKEIKAKEIESFNREINKIFKMQNQCTPVLFYALVEMSQINSDNFIEFLTILSSKKKFIYNLDRGRHIDFNASAEVQLLQYIFFFAGKKQAVNNYEIARKIVGTQFVDNNLKFFGFLSDIVSLSAFLNDVEDKALSQDYYTIAISQCFKEDWSEYS